MPAAEEFCPPDVSSAPAESPSLCAQIIGGSQREERLDVLKERMAECGLKEEDYWWYMNLRKYGGFQEEVLHKMFLASKKAVRDILLVLPYSAHASLYCQ